ncbi:unnamed protein product [Adineta steineri]|uniref:Uncharacterized protein n=1 Tax=Adineta steineri TaxID=433720 RepID=A0A813NQZ8_9BILA|nr:unnamed protein product [Adineta steineri]CAF0753068.1 unnamed protein product [Adineta steineri]CAF0869072.1 unnamed protein product [Adineta steineri]
MAASVNVQISPIDRPTCPHCHRHDQVSAIADLLPDADSDDLSFTNYRLSNRSGSSNPDNATNDRTFDVDGYWIMLELYGFYLAYFSNSLGILNSLSRRAAAARLDGTDAAAGLATLVAGLIGEKTGFCYFQLLNDSTIYVCDYKHGEGSSEMTPSIYAQPSSNAKPTCPRCHCNDHVNRYFDIIEKLFFRCMNRPVALGDNNIYTTDDPDGSFLRRLRFDARDAFGDHDATRLLCFDRTPANVLGCIGVQTDFCFFQIVDNKAVYVCEQKH